MYVKVTNGNAEKYSIGKLRKDNPNISFPRVVPDEVLAEHNVYALDVADMPSIDVRTQKIEEGDITGSGNSWVLGWNVVDKTEQEIADHDDYVAGGVRHQRDGLLAKTDYLALSDNTLSAEMAAYRQALRDITEQEGFPHDVTFPTKPE